MFGDNISKKWGIRGIMGGDKPALLDRRNHGNPRQDYVLSIGWFDMQHDLSNRQPREDDRCGEEFEE